MSDAPRMAGPEVDHAGDAAGGLHEAVASGPSPVTGIALLGCGEAARLHSRTLGRVAPDVRRHYASRDPARARAFAREYDGAGAFGTYEAALVDERLDAVMVLTPPAHHLRWTLAALEAGKHVIVEKPAFTRSEDIECVQGASRRHRRRVLVAENYPYKPLAGALRRLLARETLGRLLFIHLDAVKHQEPAGWRADPRLTGGGALLEGGIHWISLLAHLGREVRTVQAARAGVGPEPERGMALLMEYEGGGVATLSYSWEVPSPLRGLRLSRVHGTEGSATFESNGLFLAVRGRRWRLHFPGFRDLRGYRAMFRDLVGALETGRRPRYALDDARRDLELVEAAYLGAGLDPQGRRIPGETT